MKPRVHASLVALVCIVTLIVVLVASRLAHAQPAAPQPAAGTCAELWAAEHRIFAGRARGDMSAYLELASPAYLGWPWGAAEPFDEATLRDQVEDRPMPPGEAIELRYRGCTEHGDTALVYFTTHRTRMAGGRPVDQRYDNIHVFTRAAGQWRLIGSKSRPIPPPGDR